MYIQLNLRGS